MSAAERRTELRRLWPWVAELVRTWPGALLDAAAGQVGVEGWTAAEVQRTISDGLACGQRLPQRITGNLGSAAPGRVFGTPSTRPLAE